MAVNCRYVSSALMHLLFLHDALTIIQLWIWYNNMAEISTLTRKAKKVFYNPFYLVILKKKDTDKKLFGQPIQLVRGFVNNCYCARHCY